ncbi:hypothetical protein SLEP1_g19158 [Rubroshorea leprosula]|nr:hypothetical protein SLEP1_g19158 [Rubroshorea leprosula]
MCAFAGDWKVGWMILEVGRRVCDIEEELAWRRFVTKRHKIRCMMSKKLCRFCIVGSDT